MDQVRNRVYGWTLELIKEGKVLQGLILMLSTWNFAHFRNHMTKFQLKEFEIALQECGIEYFKDKRFEEIDFEDKVIKDKIMSIYKKLSDFNGVKFVGASKVMHFLYPNVFMMWDGKIIKEYQAKTSPEGYVEFMKKMQDMYKKNMFENLDKSVSIPRAIDIYNMNKYSRIKI